mgnify:CR=1 FL=1
MCGSAGRKIQRTSETDGNEAGSGVEEEERVYFRSAYGRFAKAFSMAHGDRLKLTEGDAFLVYIEVYGYDNVKGQTEREMYRALMRIWEEIQLANRGNKIELIQDPQEVEEDKKPAILKWFLPQEEIPSGLKVGFIYGRTAETSRWIYGHELEECIWNRHSPEN